MRRFLLPHSRHLRFAILCVLGYGEGNASIVYPLDTFSMYARMPGEDRSHLLVRDASGTVHRVTAFRWIEKAKSRTPGTPEALTFMVEMHGRTTGLFDKISHGLKR